MQDLEKEEVLPHDLVVDLSNKGPSNRMRSSGGFGAAAGMTDVAGIFQANRERAPRFDQMSATNIQNRGAERSAATRAEAQVAGAGINALGQVRSARIASRCCS